MNPTLNVRLLRKVKRHILAFPKSFNMSEWGSKTRKSKSIPCGTVACIAGWTCLLDKKRAVRMGFAEYERSNNAVDIAPKLLGITDDRLFYVIDWPKKFYERYATTKTHREEAQVAAEVIEYYIARARKAAKGSK